MSKCVFGKRLGAWLVLEGDHLTCKGRRNYWSAQKVEWTIDLREVTKIVAFKRDLFTVDCICLSLQDKDGLWYETNEEDPSWRALLERLELLPGFDRDWHSKVAVPPFEARETVVYEGRPGRGH